MATLNQLENNLRAVVYRQRDWTANIVDELKKQCVTVLHVEKDFVSSRKQKDQDFMKQFRTLNQSSELELKHLQVLIRSDFDCEKN